MRLSGAMTQSDFFSLHRDYITKQWRALGDDFRTLAFLEPEETIL